MAFSKRNDFQSSTIELSDMAKSFAHPARIAIIQALIKKRNQSCKELVTDLPLSQSTVSQHLKELVEAELICRKTIGNQSLYCVEWNRLERLFTLFDRFRGRAMPNRPKRNCC